MATTTKIFDDVSSYQILQNLTKLTPEAVESIITTGTLDNEQPFLTTSEWSHGDRVTATLRVDDSEVVGGASGTYIDPDLPVIRTNRLTLEERSTPFYPPIKESVVTCSTEIDAVRVGGYFRGADDINAIVYEPTEPSTRYRKGLRGYVPDIYVKSFNTNGQISDITTVTLGQTFGFSYNLMQYMYYFDTYEHDYVYSWSKTNGYNTFNSLLRGLLWFDYVCKTDISVEFNFLMFETETDLNYYLKTGDSSKAIRPKEKEKEEIEKYIYCDTMHNSLPIKDGATSFQYNALRLFYNANADGLNGSRPVVGFIDESSSNWYNIKLIENDNIEYTNKALEKLGATDEFSEIDGLVQALNPAWTYSELVTVGSGFFYGDYNTNIPIFANESLARDYLNGLIDESQSISGGGAVPSIKNKTGQELKETLFNNGNGYTVGSETLCLSYGQCVEFFNLLFTSDESIIEQIKTGLQFYGTNPVDCIVDFFAIPFNASTFAQLKSSNEVSFGSYSHTFDQNMPRLEQIAPIMKQCFQTYVTGAYNDWRDWQSNYYLYLPYVGVTSIDVDKYLYKNLTCNVAVDVRTGQIKYFLLANNILVDTFETVCRVSLPISSVNNYQNAREKLDSITNVVSGGVNSLKALPTGQSPLGGISQFTNALLDTQKLPQLNVSGNSSPSNAWLDPSYCYLLIHSPEFEYNGVVNNYNMPDNQVRQIGANRGYLVATDVILNGCSNCSEEEKNAIATALRNGVFV